MCMYMSVCTLETYYARFVSVCMYVCMYVCIYLCVYIHWRLTMTAASDRIASVVGVRTKYCGLYVCMYVRTYVRMYVCMHACMYVCMYAAF